MAKTQSKRLLVTLRDHFQGIPVLGFRLGMSRTWRLDHALGMDRFLFFLPLETQIHETRIYRST